MIVLAIDTAGTACNVALYDAAGDVILAVAGADIGRGHAERLMGFIDDALETAGIDLDAVGRIAVTIGPGSFTGIRVGVATARGLGLALGIPVLGISVLQALAVDGLTSCPGQPVLVVTDAKRDEVYLQSFDAAGVPLEEARALDTAAARAEYGAFAGAIIGSGAALLAQCGTGDERADGPAGRPSDIADIGRVARLGALADPAVALPKPLYLRGPDVRSQAGFAVAHA